MLHIIILLTKLDHEEILSQLKSSAECRHTYKFDYTQQELLVGDYTVNYNTGLRALVVGKLLRTSCGLNCTQLLLELL